MSKSPAKPPRPPPRTRGRPPAQKPAEAQKPAQAQKPRASRSRTSKSGPASPTKSQESLTSPEPPSRPNRAAVAAERRPRSPRRSVSARESKPRSCRILQPPAATVSVTGTPRMSLEEPEEVPKARKSRKKDVSRPSDGSDRPGSLAEGSVDTTEVTLDSPGSSSWIPTEAVRAISLTGSNSPQLERLKSPEGPPELPDSTPMESEGVQGSPDDPIGQGRSDTKGGSPTVPPTRSRSKATCDQVDPIAVGTSDTRGGSPRPETQDTVPPARSQSPDPMLEDMPDAPDPIQPTPRSQEFERFRESSPQAPEKPYWQVLQEQDPHQMLDNDEEDQDRYYRDRLDGRWDDEEDRSEQSSRSEASGSSDEEPQPKAYDPFEEERPDSPSWRQRAAAQAELSKKAKVRKIKKASRDIPSTSRGAPDDDEDEDQERIPKKVRKIQNKDSRDPPDDYDDDQKTRRIHSPARRPPSDDDDDDHVTPPKKARKIQKKTPRRSPTSEGVVPEDVRPEDIRTEDVAPEAPFGDPDDKIRLMLEVESGNDSDYDEAEDRALWDEPNKREITKAKLYPGKERDTDVLPRAEMIKCDFYRNDAGDFFMTLPRLPIVAQKSATVGPLPDDYRDFPDKISGWFEVAEKRLKKKPDWPLHKKRYPCVWCDWSFDATVKLAKHRYVHRNIGVFACQVCLTLFNHHYNLYQHWRMSCTPVTKSKSDHEMKNIDISSVRNYVLCAMGTENRAQSYHVFGGVFFIPSQWFLDTKYNVIDPHEQNDCHLCHLAVPTKFLECHGDVHRGRFRIDGKIYGDYFCHVCGKIFKSKFALLEHWRLDCPEVVYYLPEDVALDDEELVGFAWLILQMAIAHDKILIMAKNSSLALEKWAHRHAKENNMIYLLDRYYHYPQELWPLKLGTGEDIIRDAIPIFGTRAFLRSINGEVTLYNPDIAVHIANLIATACPDFYATGAVFTEILGCESKTEATKSVFRVVLRYTTAGSVISTYKINLRTCPSLRVSRPPNLSRSPGDYNVEEDFTAYYEESRKMSTTDKNNQDYTWSCVGRMRDQVQRNNWLKRDALEYTCRICRKILGQRSAREHWLLECAPLKIILPNVRDRSYMDEGVETSIAKQMKKVGAKVYIDWVRRKNERADSVNFQSVDRIGEYNKTTFWCSDAGLEQIRKGSAKAMSNAMRRDTERWTTKQCMELETQSAVVCPHCGGRMSAARLILHLEQRHFYDPEAKNQEECQAECRSVTVDNTYKLVKDMIEMEEDRLGRKMMPIMSEKQYKKCVTAHQKAIRKASDTPDRQGLWLETTTIRQVHLTDCPLALMRSNLGLITLEEPDKQLEEDLEPFHPLAKIIRETDVNHENAPGSAGDVWLPPNHKLKIPDFQETDPLTGDELADAYAAIQRAQNVEFFGDFQRESHTNGLQFRSIAEFYGNRGVGKQRRGDGDEYGDDEEGLYDDLDGADNERAQFSDGPDADSDYDDSGDEDDVDYGEVTGEEDEDGGANRKRRKNLNAPTGANDDEGPPIVRQRGRHDNTDPSEETLESVQQRLQHRRQQKKKHREMSDRVPNKPPTEFDKSNFGPLPINMGPKKLKSLPLLSVVVKNTADIDHRADHKKLSAFSVDYENCASDFRESAGHFRKWYKKRLPPKTKGMKVSQMDPADLENALKFEDMEMEGKVGAVVDENGVVYLNGYITACKGRDYDHDTVVKIIKDGWVRQFKVFNCTDASGKFKFYWPYHKKTDTASKFCESFERVYFDEQQQRIAQIIASKEKYLPGTCFLRGYTTNPSRNHVDSDDSVKDEQSDESPDASPIKMESARKKLEDLEMRIAKIAPKKATKTTKEDSEDEDSDDVKKVRKSLKKAPKKTKKKGEDSEEDSDDVEDEEMNLDSSDEVSSEEFEDFEGPENPEGSDDEDMSHMFSKRRAAPPEELEEDEEAPEASSAPPEVPEEAPEAAGAPEEPEEPEEPRERPSGFSIDAILDKK